jgi:magnesium chelatase family protein
MSVARTMSVALVGLSGAIIEIEAEISANTPKFTLIGLPDTVLSESRERVRAAAASSGCPLTDMRLTVNLSPASLPKHGAAFDLAIALACLAAAGDVASESVASVVHLGELGLDGRLRPTAGILPAVLAAAKAGRQTVMVPAGNAQEAALVSGLTIVPIVSLRDAAIWHGGNYEPVASETLLVRTPEAGTESTSDLSEIVGNDEAVRALVTAAAGGHHLFLLGPPGAGKTMLAERLPGILPDLDSAAALEATSIRSLAGLPIGGSLVTRPPYEAPHHTATAAAIVGGGSGPIRPGAAVRAAHGVLFLDESGNGKHTSFLKEVFDGRNSQQPAGVSCSSGPVGPKRGLSRFHQDWPRDACRGNAADLPVFAVVEVPQGQSRCDRAAAD